MILIAKQQKYQYNLIIDKLKNIKQLQNNIKLDHLENIANIIFAITLIAYCFFRYIYIRSKLAITRY